MGSETETRQGSMWADLEPEAQASSPAPVRPEVKGQPRFEPVSRQQMVWRTVDVERLIEADHPARAIGELVGRLDLRPFYETIRAVEGVAGRPTLDPQLLISLWIYAYSEGVSSAREVARVSETDPEARIMKQSDGGFAPSYNVQISTDAVERIIVGVGVSQSGSDQGQLGAAMDKVQEQMGRPPEQAVVDGGFTTREAILEMDRRGVDLIGSMGDGVAQSACQRERQGIDAAFGAEAFIYQPGSDTYQCPAGKVLTHLARVSGIGVTQHQYRARREDCAACGFKPKCCPQANRGRTVVRAEEDPVVVTFRAKMESAEAKQIYRQRGGVAEFPNAWIKAKIGLRQFRLRGWVKVTIEAIWACLTYNIQQWIRLRWRKEAVLGTA